ncbi:MAG TPA: sporulation membrane protein YtrI [Bacillota bacterium]|nr:sporulation membrane protein YtrI [Bacillota bacterium]
MHIPPYHKKTSWQWLMTGAFLGGVIGYIIVIFMHGTMYEQLLEEKVELQSQVDDLKNQNKSLLEEQKDLGEKSKEPATIDSIEITIDNEDELRLDPLMRHELKTQIKDEINHIVGKDLNIIAKSDRLLISTIENKTFSIDEFTYDLEVVTLIIGSTVKITVKGNVHN